MSSATTSGTRGDSSQGEDETRCVRWFSSDPWPPPLSCCLGMCRWSSAGRTAPSASSEDGSPTARDSARSPANTGSVSASGLWLRLACACLVMCDSCSCAPRRPRNPWKADIYTTLVGYLWFHPINKIMIATVTWTTALQLKKQTVK